MAQLAEQNRAFTMTTRTVAAGASTSSSLPMDDLKLYVYDGQTGTWAPGSESWTWENDATYTIMELSIPADSACSFYSLDGGKINGVTFQYDETTSQEYVAVNKLKTWMLEVSKQDSATGNGLYGAIFGLYTLKPELAMESSGLPEELKEQPQMTITKDGKTWYLMDVKSSDGYGNLSWTALTEDSYYLYELQAPEGYAICETDGIRVSKELNGKTPLTVKNMQIFELPEAGGAGVTGYIVWGTGLLLLALLLWIARAKRRTDR
jgi:LPXTG-motif cell wall-anchored protein